MKFPSLPEANVNLTPLIDVVFVVLVMFIVVVPILQRDKVALAPGRELGHEMRGQSPVSIHVRSDNTIWIRGNCVSPSHLQQILASAKKRYPDATPQLYHDKRAQFGTYQMVKNATEQAGFSKMDVVLEPA